MERKPAAVTSVVLPVFRSRFQRVSRTTSRRSASHPDRAPASGQSLPQRGRDGKPRRVGDVGAQAGLLRPGELAPRPRSARLLVSRPTTSATTRNRTHHRRSYRLSDPNRSNSRKVILGVRLTDSLIHFCAIAGNSLVPETRPHQKIGHLLCGSKIAHSLTHLARIIHEASWNPDSLGAPRFVHE
jgi:hypothetical protein